MEEKILEEHITNEVLEEAERFVLATAMHSPNALPLIVSKLNEESFYEPSHKLIFNAINELNLLGNEISSSTISNFLNEKNKLEKAGGIKRVAEISNYFYSDEGIETYIEIVFKAAAGRKFDDALAKLQIERKTNKNLDETFKTAQETLLNIDLDSKSEKIISISDSTDEFINKLEMLEKQKGNLTGVTTGFSSLDKITSGLQPSDFIILAARPSMGKTAFALNLAYNAATLNSKNSVAIFSIEMPHSQLTQRIISRMTKIDSNKLRTGKGLSKDEWSVIHKAKDKLDKTKVYIDDTPGITVAQIYSKLNKLKRDHDINLCVIDYLQLITTPGASGNDRQNEISNISRQLKRIARDLNVPIICLSQLSRSVEKREDKRPMMSDLRDSGAIEQDADIIMFLYRPDYYLNTSEGQSEPISKTELIISKHRNGATGNVSLGFHKEFGKFDDMNNN